MENENHNDLISVDLPLPFVHGLLALTHLMDSRVTDALLAAFDSNQETSRSPKAKSPPLTAGSKRAAPVHHNTDLVAEILGKRLYGTSLSNLFSQCVDMVYELEPASIERLSDKKTHARRYVSRHREGIHIKSPHLQTIETKSGWWISGNISEQQATTAMRLLAEAANLEFGIDFIFPLP